MTNFIKNHFTKSHIAALVLLAAAIAAAIVLNNYVLDMTQGHYNIFRILFM